MSVENVHEVVATVVEHAEQSSEAAHGAAIHVELAAEQFGTFLGLPITNTLITSWIVIFLLAIVAFFVGKRLTLIPSKIQLVFEEMFTFIIDYMAETLGNEKLAKRYFPLILTIFLFVFTSNVLEFTPGIGSVGFFEVHGFSPLLRSVNTDLNVTVALAIIAFAAIEIAGVTTIGLFKYIGKFINFKSFIGFFVGIIELMSELIRLISFSFRLFGNIFAGEVLIAVVSYFVPAILPVPLMGFEMFVGFVQAVIFSLLTLMFIKLAVTETH